MTQENKPDQAGADKASVNKDEASNAPKPGELSIEELAKVSGGRVISGRYHTNTVGWVGPIANTFTKG